MTAPRVGRLRVLGAICVAAALTTSGCGGGGEPVTDPAAMASPGGELVLEFDEGLADRGEELGRVQNSGNALMRIAVVEDQGGALTRVRGRYGYAVRTPGYRASEVVPLAALAVRPRGADLLSPGETPLKWGADVQLQAEALKAVKGSNVLQRGLFADPVQFKLQVDYGVPSCRVRGSLGEAMVEARRPLRAQEWYRLHCHLRDGRLSLKVGRAGHPGWTVHSVAADVGALDFARSTPVAVGAKLNSGGEIVTDSADQFHGLLDNVFVDIG